MQGSQTLGQTGDCTSVKWVSFCIIEFILSCCTEHIQIALYVILLFISYENKLKRAVNIDDL